MPIGKAKNIALSSAINASFPIEGVRIAVQPDASLELIHRLDRETSGCLLLALNGAALKHYSELFRTGNVDKSYLCLMHGRLPEAVVEVDAPLRKVEQGGQRIVEVRDDGKPSLSRFHRLEELRGASYVRVELLTGRTHQIRAHARYLGLPLAGDELYSSREALKHYREQGLNRLFLHAHQVSVQTPSGQVLDISSPLPESLRETLGKLGA